MKPAETAVIYEVGTVKLIYGDYAFVALLYSYYCDSDCENCQETCIETTKLIRVKNIVHAKIGERVLLCMPNRSAFYASLLYVVVPCFLIYSIYEFSQIFLPSYLFILLGCIVFMICFVFMVIMDNILTKLGKYKISIIKILNFRKKDDKMKK